MTDLLKDYVIASYRWSGNSDEIRLRLAAAGVFICHECVDDSGRAVVLPMGEPWHTEWYGELRYGTCPVCDTDYVSECGAPAEIAA